MNKVLIYGFAIIMIVIQSCGPKEKQEKSTLIIDSVKVESSINDSTLIDPELLTEENIVEEVKQVQKTEAIKKVTTSPVVTKTSEKEVVKTTTVSKPAIKVEEVVKKEVIVEKEVEKPIEVKKEADIVVEKPKEMISANSWIVPAKDKALKNPLEASKENLKEAKIVYDIQCKSCHGSKGLGDGPKARSMKGDLGDFSSASFQAQTDGELFYKTKVGKADMPSFAKKLSDEDIWLAVHYMRTLKK